MRNLEFAMRLVSEGVADMEDRGFKVVPSVAREATAYAFGAVEAVGSPDKIINNDAKVKHITGRIEEILSGGRMKQNPKAGTEGLHFVVTQDDAGDTVLHVFDSEDQAGLYHGQLRGYGGVKRIGRLKGSKGMSLGYIVEGVTKQFGAEPRIMRHDQGETNPVRPRKGEKARDFIARCMSEEKMSFPEPKQRIAVCLSKSRKRNPVFDTGCDE